MTQSQAPGKIILTGEHAVVYGRPALVMAVNRYVRTTIEARDSSTVAIEFKAGNQSVQLHYSWPELHQLFHRLNERFDHFTAGEVAVTEVLDNPLELIPYALALFIVHQQSSFAAGMDIRIATDIPIGCGMGSSASVVLSLMRAVAGYLAATVTPDQLYDLACDCERLRHGITSGVDPYVCLYGGFIKFHQRLRVSLPFPELEFQLVLTGTPAASTGECVMSVKKNFDNSAIWDDFEAVTTAIETALSERDEKQLLTMIRQNHQLLSAIGVTPLRVRKFIEAVERLGGAAKISGAGSVSGEHAGVVIVFGPRLPEDLCRHFGYQLLSISGDRHGACLI